MKKLTTIIAMLALIATTTAYGQSKAVEQFKNKYKDDRDATVITLQGNIFKLLASATEYVDDEDEDIKALGRMADGIASMQIVTLPKYEVGLEQDEIKQFKSSLNKEAYQELMHIKEGKETTVIYSQGKNDEVRNMLILVDNRSELALITIEGTLKMKDLAHIAKHRDKWK